MIELDVQSKKVIVHYNNAVFSRIALGQGALVLPIDHRNHIKGQRVCNTIHILTSRVLKIFPDGSFETLNTFYKPRSTT